jgi:exodeoxyribonuclease III
MAIRNKKIKIISWNVNGLRACYKKGCWEWFLKEKPDVFCLQETKAEPDQLPEEVRNVKGYSSFFSYPKFKKGYSGVALYTNQKPDDVEKNMGKKRLDQEGRLIVAYLDKIALLNVYFPNGGGGSERLKFKLDFYDYFLDFIENLRNLGFSIIFCGDINTAHKEIDLARPKENQKRTGFLPEERAWVDKVVSRGYLDVFRFFYPQKKDAYTYWDMKTFARERNVGWRIDYFFVSEDLIPDLVSMEILDQIYGSDHCPILLTIRA